MGLVEMTRKRTRQSITKLLSEPCPYCDGKGTVKSRDTICYEIFREIKRRAPSISGRTLVLHVHPDVANLLCEEERAGIENWRRSYPSASSSKTRCNSISSNSRSSKADPHSVPDYRASLIPLAPAVLKSPLAGLLAATTA